MQLRLILGALLWFGSALAGRAGPADPVTLAIGYRARPETRVAFRTWLQTKGAAQFADWQAAGRCGRVRILFSALAGAAPIDALVLVEFARYADTSRWIELERDHPGGLTAEALQWAVPVGARWTETIAAGRADAAPARAGVFLVALYEVSAAMPKYVDYARGYVVPQARGWIEAGVLSGYEMLASQNPLHDPWDALLVLEYPDFAALAQRDEVKRRVRERLLATDAAWAEWSRDKQVLRKELALFSAEAIDVPRRARPEPPGSTPNPANPPSR